MKVPKKIIAFVEPESLFLPNLLAQLAHKEVLHGIIVIKYKFSFEAFKKFFYKMYNFFGMKELLKLVTGSLIAKFLNIFYSKKFYSIEKVSQRFNIPLYTVDSIHGKKTLELLDKLNADYIFTQTGKKLKPNILEKGSFVNKHCSLLPGYAGVYPVFWASLNNEQELGVTIHLMDKDFDTGPIISQKAVSISNNFFKDYHILHDMAAQMLVDFFKNESVHTINRVPEKSYYSFPQKTHRKEYLKKSVFGNPLRIHPDIG